ncbi:hypothetical protein V9L05_22390 (plasmid) [Bernardetia sp. Wsw4-3y2]|uniref:hypothetical protein n=1 Tax=Bernardetia sp. Wsw4-3y2 TaxID=3127471 RepID=UPI0030D2C713
MTTHILQKEKHQDFLKQERIDPITGDILQEGDEIVICASCKSAFLVDSWEYMDRKHCQQKLTLKKIPINSIFKIERPLISLNVNLEVKTVSINRASKMAAVNIYLPTTCLGITFDTFFDTNFSIVSVISFLLSWFFFWVVNDYKSYLQIKGKFLSFKKEEKWEDSILLSSVKNIRYYKPSRYWMANLLRQKSDKLYTLEFTVDYNKKHKVLITKKTLEHIKSETNLLQKFNKNSLPSTSVNIEIEQHTV